MVEILVRHGDRTPYHIFNFSINANYKYPSGLGLLTPLGVNQTKMVGERIKNNYGLKKGLYNPFSNDCPETIFVRSTSSQRAIDTASNIIDGMFLSNVSGVEATEQNYKTLYNQTQIPIVIVPQQEDSRMHHAFPCKKRAKIYRSRFNDTNIQKHVFYKYRDIIELFKTKGNTEITDYHEFREVFDSIFTEKHYFGLKQPDWLTEEVYERYFKAINESVDYTNGAAGYDQPESVEIKKNLLGELFYEMVSNLKDKAIFGPEKPNIIIYSAHDITVFMISLSLKIKKKIIGDSWMHYTGSIGFELHLQKATGKYFVRVIWSDNAYTEYKPVTKYVSGCGGEDYCELGVFTKISEKYMLAPGSEC
uniref:Histidine acid phosphatase n=1 Tax=Rhabditophanes sp. KR3021 TaxID=114890 RepID=A0AC35UEJ9_9BILA